MNTETPEGLHRMQYAIHILEEVLGWPAKGNAELVADCILSVSKSRKITIHKGHDYLVRAIRLAKEQGVEVDRFFFMEGKYTLLRPEQKARGDYKPLTKAEEIAIKADQAQLFASPEWKEMVAKVEIKLARPIRITPERRAELRAQAERLQK